jgi:hypothetical protein
VISTAVIDLESCLKVQACAESGRAGSRYHLLQVTPCKRRLKLVLTGYFDVSCLVVGPPSVRCQDLDASSETACNVVREEI